MARLAKTVYLTIHGHFYQPPRENPWTEKIELQPSAQPFHDWNERILVQCYQPNAMARIVDSKGKVLEIVNNFRLLNFNIGPTLMAWLEKRSPLVYRLIIEADRLSVRERSGHGNALAQIYNHMILPLADERDQRTQVRWGIFEFEKRFGRSPEGMWLPETGASSRTLEILIEEGIRFTILAPQQADRVRRLGPGSSWEDVADGSIDPTRPYRFFHTQDKDRFIDLFFFDAPVSRDMSFGDLLFDAKKFLDRLLHAHRSDRHHPELVHSATDGETFGHHRAYGERVIAFLLHEETERHGFKRTNYGEYLEKFPPQYEVELKPGEGTSWSCVHGVARWKEDCGCHTGGGPGWNQKWRGPLRDAVRFLEVRLAEIYQKGARPLLTDPWAARDDYIQIILDRSIEAQKAFFKKHAVYPLSESERIEALKLLEMERFALLSETSCGWFFNELSGIETVQILRYSLRALELAAGFGAQGLEPEFLEILAKAKSNLPELGNGRGVWEKLVKPSLTSREKIIAHYAFRKLFELEVVQEDFFNYKITEGEEERESFDEKTLLMGTVEITGINIPESKKFIYAIFQKRLSDVQCFVKSLDHADELHRINVRPLSHLRKNNSQALAHDLKESFKTEPFALRDLFPEERDAILRVLSRQLKNDYYQTAIHFYEENYSWAELFHEAGSPLPEEFRRLIDWVMGERLLGCLQKVDTAGSFEEITHKAKETFKEAHSRGFSVQTQPAVEFLSGRLNSWIEKLFFNQPDPRLIEKIEKTLALAKELKLELNDQIAQELFFIFAQKVFREHSHPEMIPAILHLGTQLGFNMERYEHQLRVKS